MEPEEISDQLTISPEQAFYIFVKAREFDEQIESTNPDSGSNPADDSEVDVLEEEADDPVQQELEEARDMRDKHISEYLIGTPKLGDYLEEGLAQLGLSLEDFERDRL
jgi:hypothetical protein